MLDQRSQKLSSFAPRHIGPNSDDIQQMLKVLGFPSLDALIDQTVPRAIRLKRSLKLPEAESEYAALVSFKKVAAKNQVFRSYIGMGYYDTITPPVIGRNILENPGWYTAYTLISQNCPRAIGSAAEFSNPDYRFNRFGNRQCLVTG